MSLNIHSFIYSSIKSGITGNVVTIPPCPHDGTISVRAAPILNFWFRVRVRVRFKIRVRFRVEDRVRVGMGFMVRVFYIQQYSRG